MTRATADVTLRAMRKLGLVTWENWCYYRADKLKVAGPIEVEAVDEGKRPYTQRGTLVEKVLDVLTTFGEATPADIATLLDMGSKDVATILAKAARRDKCVLVQKGGPGKSARYRALEPKKEQENMTASAPAPASTPAPATTMRGSALAKQALGAEREKLVLAMLVDGPLSNREIARALGVHDSSSFNVMARLLKAKLVRQDSLSRKYSLVGGVAQVPPINLTPPELKKVAELIENPPPPTEALREALREVESPPPPPTPAKPARSPVGPSADLQALLLQVEAQMLQENLLDVNHDGIRVGLTITHLEAPDNETACKIKNLEGSRVTGITVHEARKLGPQQPAVQPGEVVNWLTWGAA